jgi:hypothetical protein
MTDKPGIPEDQRAFENELHAVQAKWDRMESAEPPDLVDQAVRNAARRDLEPRRKSRPLRWLGGFATATVVVLAVTVMLEQDPTVPEPSLQDTGEYRRDAAPVPKLEESATMKSVQPPLPPAEAVAQTREAKRQKQPVQAASEEADRDAMRSAIIPPAFRADQLSMTPGIPAKNRTEQPELAETAADAEEMQDQDLAPRSAEDWVQQMLQLRDYGQKKRLAGEIAAFRHYYPDYPLPEQLAEPQP